VMLGAFILVIATTSVLPVVSSLGMGYVAMTFALIMLIRYKHEVEQFYKAVDWDLIGFFMALFVVIHMLEYAGVLDLIGQGITWIIGEDENRFGVGALLVSAAGFSSVTDNIPLAAMLGKILAAQGTAGYSSLWWSLILGANLGGNLTPIGSASTLVAVTIIHKHNLKLSFGGFFIKALPFAAMHIVLATIYVLVFL
jgi:Na+/H+ antiporter NhaD/arsenite permease-like protein